MSGSVVFFFMKNGSNCLEEGATPGESGLSMAFPLEFILEAQKKWV